MQNYAGNYVLVDAGILTVMMNSMERSAAREGRPVLQEIVDEVKKTIINVTKTDAKIWVEE